MKDALKNSVLMKILLLIGLMLLLCIPLAQIDWLVQERGASQQRAAAELAETYAGPQTLIGPVLVVPYVERWTEEQRDAEGKLKARIPRSRQLAHLVYPDKLDLSGTVTPQERHRGIFSVLFYDLQGGWRGSFAPFDPAALAHSEKDSTLELQAPAFAFALSDVRGIQGMPALQLAGEALRFVPRIPGVGEGSWLANGVHAPLAGAALQAYERREPLAFDLRMTVVGQERLSVAPVAGETTTRLALDWPHLSFAGRFLAVQRTRTATGYEARWAVSSLVSAAGKQVASSQGAKAAGRAEGLDTFDVSLIQPQNAYSMANRAVKYAMLFIGMVLMAAFMFELFRKLRLHPVQYALVGLSIALFFLLLLALSEKLAFGLAYLAAGGASVALLAVYFSAVLQGWRRGLSLAGFVGVLYAALYGLLVSQDNALLLGALLVFGMLAVLMLATRRVNWYQLSAPPAAASA